MIIGGKVIYPGMRVYNIIDYPQFNQLVLMDFWGWIEEDHEYELDWLANLKKGQRVTLLSANLIVERVQ